MNSPVSDAVFRTIAFFLVGAAAFGCDSSAAEQGAVGPEGPPGADGAAGERGPAGAQGATGATGADGIPGIQGDPGPTGPVGPMGPAGADGLPGAMGALGPAGATGPAGPPGISGWLVADLPASFTPGVSQTYIACPANKVPLAWSFHTGALFTGAVSPASAFISIDNTVVPNLVGWTLNFNNTTNAAISGGVSVICTSAS